MNDPDFNRRLRETFQAEASEHVRALSLALSELERAADADARRDVVEQIFRTTHTLKGAARMVGEGDAEALCHALEQQLSGLKQHPESVPPAVVGDLHRQVGAIMEALGLHRETPAAPPAAEVVREAPPERSERVAPTITTAAGPVPRAPHPVVAGQVRVPAARLDALLVRAEEMVSAKLSGDEHAAALRAVASRGATAKREWERVRSSVAALRRFVDSGEASPIGKELLALVHYLDAQHEFTRSWSDELGKLARGATNDQRRVGTLVEQLLDEAKEVLMQPFASLLEMFPAFVRETAAKLGKEVDIHVEGAETEIDRRVLEELRDALIHLVRNAIDHGIEPAAERLAKGKPAQGNLTIAVREKTGGNVEVTVSDDGRGIDTAEIARSARRLGVLPADAAEPTEQEALEMLFGSGFSTKTEANELSGRGLGLAIVREKAERTGGLVELSSTLGRGTIFQFQLPVTLARFRGVFVTARRQAFVVPSSHVRRVLRLRESDLRRVKNQTLIEVDDQSVLLLSLAEILGLGTAKPEPRDVSDAVFVVLIESGLSRIALRIDTIPHEQEVVMKSLGKMLRRARHYVGATIAGDGTIVPVLNVGALLAGATRRRGRARAVAPQETESRKRTILIAEDSITSRSLFKNILQTAGFEVRTAVDGVDALTTLKYEPVDLVISDVQMPRMDGFELISKIRADKALTTLPVILITSLASREDKARGVDVGANAYIVKSSFDQSDLLEAIRRLLP